MTASEYWQERGAVMGGADAAEVVRHLGDPAAEVELAARGEATCVVPLLDVAPLRVTGSDRGGFLHGQLSNAVQGIPAGGCNHTLQLNARGQVVGEGDLCVRGSDVFLAVEDGRGREVRASLEAHIVFDDVRIEDLTGTLTALTVQGPEAAAVVRRAFGEAPEPGRFAQPAFGGGSTSGAAPLVLLLRRRRSPAGGVDVHLLARQLPEAVTALEEAGAVCVGAAALTVMRVLAGVPSAAHEGGAGALPQELGLASAVSFRKGCYLGQEIMARIEARGAVRKGLARLRLSPASGGAPSPEGLEGRAVRQGEREVGRLGTVARMPDGKLAALSVLRLDLPQDPALTVDDGEGGVAVAAAWPLPTAAAGSAETDAEEAALGAQGGGSAEGGVQPGKAVDPEL